MPDSKVDFLRPRTHRFALESRQLFDGAAFVEAATHAADAPQAGSAPADAHHAEPAHPASPQQHAPAAAESAPAPQPAPSAPHEVYVVDRNVANWQQLAASVPAGSELILLDTGSSGVQQLADSLGGQSGITALHILSHGSAGEITLGNEQVDAASLERSAEAWRTIGASLGADADILLYGCDVAADGARFSQALASLTGADVASSSDATGAATRGADWTLESSTGHIEARTFADADYDGVMAAPTVTTTATRLVVTEPSSLNAPGADRGTLSGWTITDDGSGNVTVAVVVEDPTKGTLSSASTTGVIGIAGGYSFTGSVAAANAWVNQLVFTAADVELGTTAASTRIVVTATDSEAPALTATRALDVTVTPSNDPVAVPDATQSVNEIGNTVLTVATLNAIDPEVTLGTQVPSQVVYALTADTAHGYLMLNGTRLGIGAVFTQQDVIDGLVVYVHTATGADQNTQDGFAVQINDGATPSNRSDTAAITLDVTPLNQAPTVSGSGTILEGQPANALDGGGNPASVVGNFIVAEGGGDDADAALTVRLTSLPTDGTLFFSGTVTIGGVSQAVTNRAVTQADIDAGFVFAYGARGGLTYANAGNRDTNPATPYPYADGFGVAVSDGGGGAGGGAVQTTNATIALTIQPTDDDPALDPASSLVATVTAPGDGSGAYTVTLTEAMLNAFDVDSSDDRLTIAVTSQAMLDQGRLLLNGQVLPSGGTFTIADVKAGRVQYVQQAGAGPNQTDVFQFQVRDNTTSVRWNADGTRVERDGGQYNDGGTPGNYVDDSLRTFDFTFNLVETPTGNNGSFPPLDNATTHADSNYAGTNDSGVSRGTLSEGGTIVLAGTGSDFSVTPGLSYTADGVPPEQVVYTILGFDGVAGGAWNGVLQRFNGTTWVAMGVYDTFTQADLNAGSIRFQHDDASEDFESSVRLSASAGVLVDDGAGGLTSDSWDTSFTFFITPVNDTPVTLGSSNTVIPEGGTAYITTGQLQITDADDAASESYLESSATLPGGGSNYAFDNAATGAGALQVEVLTLPPGGTLQYSTDGGANWLDVTAGQLIDAALITGSAGNTGLRFVSDGSELRNTSFDVRAVDRWGATSNSASVGIQITNLNDAPQIAPDPTQADPATSVNNPLTVAEGGYAQISTAMLSAFDPDSSTTQVQYTITGAAAHGSIAYSTDGVTFLRLGVGSSFSEADVQAGRIYYLHGGDESDGATYPDPPSDSFTFSLGDGDKEQPGNQFWIYVTPANDAPVVTGPTDPIPVDSASGVNNPVPGFSVADADMDTPAAGETDFVQVTVRLLDADGNAFNAGGYAGVTIGSTSLGGVTVDGDKNGTADFLTLRGTRAQVNAALAGLTVTFGDDRDAVYQVQVIADDRLRDAAGTLQSGANGGPLNESDPPGTTGIAVPATEYDWYSAAVPTAGAITGNLSAASVRIFASSENDPATLAAPPSANVVEDQATYIGGGFVVADPESAAFDTPVTVRLSVPSGTLGIGGAGAQGSVTPGGGQAVTVTGDNTGLLVLTGRASDIQALLNSGTATGLTYRSAADVNHDANGGDAGDVTLTVSFDDVGSRIGDDVGAGSVAHNPPDVTMALTIAPVNDAPTVSLGGGVTPGTPVVLTGGATPTAVPGFVVGDVDVDGDIVGNGAASDVTDGESDFLQLTIRITDAGGNALPPTSYDGTDGEVTITSSNAGSSGVAVDGVFDGTGSALVISGTRAQVQAYLDGLAVALTGELANGDVGYRVEVIADDRVRDGGGVVTGANGGQNDDAGNGTAVPPATAINPYAATPGGLASNVASTYRTLFPSSVNDPAHIAAGDLNAGEGSGSVTLTGITVTDQDALDTSILTTTVSVPAGLSITSIGAGSGGSAVIAGDGRSVTITGTLAEINSRINTIAVQLPDAPGVGGRPDWNGSFTVTVVVDDEGNTGGRPATLAPGDNSTTGTFAYQDGVAADLVTTRSFSVTVDPLNDAPVVVNGNAETLPAVNEDVGNAAAGSTVAALFGSHFSDAADQIDNSGIDATGGSTPDGFFGVAITGLALDPAQGEWQYSLDGTTWTAVGARSDANALVLASSAQLRFVPAADFHGAPNTLTVRLVETDANADSATPDPVSGSTVNVAGTGNGGTTVYSAGTVVLSTSVANVNDRPTAIDAVLAAGVEDQQGQPAPAATAASLFGGGYGDATDNQAGVTGGGNAATPFGGIAIVGNAATAAEGGWQYSTDSGASWTTVPTGASDGSAVLLPPDAQLRFVPAADYNGTPGALTVRVSDTAVAAGAGDISATVGAPTSQWSATHTLSTTVAPRNDTPVLAGTPTNANAVENGQTGTGVSIAPVALLSGATVSDLDLATTPGLGAGIFGAGRITVGLDGYQPGDLLLVDGALPAGATVSGGNGAPLVVQFDADTTLAEVQGVLNALSYRSTSDNPTDFGADPDRVYTVVINDGDNVQAGGNAGGPALDSNVLTGTLTIVAANDLPTANDDTHSIVEDTASVGANVVTGRVPGQGDTDPDHATLTVSAVRTGTEAGSGTAGSVGSPLAGNYGSVVLDADGSYTYTLNNADPRVQALTAGETLTEVYTYTVSDGAGGTDIAQLTITITGAADGGAGDDIPAIVAADQNGAATGHLSVNEAGLTSAGDTSETAGSTFAISAADGLSSIGINGTTLTLAQLQAATPGAPLTITTAEGVLNITGFTPTGTAGGLTTAGDVSYTYTLLQRQDHSGGEVTDPFALTVIDRDGDVANGTLTVLIVDDAPLAASDANSVDEDAGTNTVGGDLKANDRNGADDGNGVPLTGVSFGATQGMLGSPLATAYGSIVVNADGTYTYTLDNDNSAVNALKDGETLTETLSYTIVDADGDTSTATLTITINGRTDSGGPTIVPADGNGAAAGQTEVHESGLADGPGGADPRETSAGTIAIGAADGLTSVTVGGTTLTLAELQALGATPRSIDTGEGLLVLTGFTATSSVGGVPTAGELSYTYTLKNPLDQPGAAESFDPVALQVSDAGGGSSTGTLQVRIVDDVPQAADDAASIDEDATPNTVSGDVKANDANGADDANGVPVTGVSFGGTPGSTGIPLATAYGSIVVNADGSYTYTLDNANPVVQHLLPGETLTEAVSYTITDADGDTSTATITITIGAADDGVSLVLDDGNGPGSTGEATVSERGLGDGGDPSETTTGRFVIRTPDGLGNLEVAGTTLTPAQLAQLGTTAITVVTDKGLLTLTGYDPATGAVTYSYTLTGRQPHAGGEVTDDIAIVVRDRDGDTSAGRLRVLVIDDVPTARDDAASVDTTRPGASTVGGNVFGPNGRGPGDVGDRIGADVVAEPVTAFSFEGRPGVIGGGALAGAYGSLRMNANGSYSYEVDTGNARVAALSDGQTLTEVFSYTITDADGSTSTAQLVVTIRGASQFRPPEGDQVFPIECPAQQRVIAQGMAPALFVQFSVHESQRVSQEALASIAARVAGGASYSAFDQNALPGVGQDMSNIQHVSRDGVAASLRLLEDLRQSLALRGLGAGLPDGGNALFGDFPAFAAPEEKAAPPAQGGGERIVVPGARTSAAPLDAHAPHAELIRLPAAAHAADVAESAARPADAARSFSGRLAASAAERGTVRDLVRVQQHEPVRVTVQGARS
ncbi:cadherin-like domain-containing protein [Variovorax sp. RA8]|uniref:cadherin-like domain-containing protein n=1 Tax=Variovorax sp. (strain JCM 16519 / RA8) TaxID=662548 RepID=UPI0013169215|nr:cadherin-like domain-containing protein [Variovorax sp. RA8]VTU22034.1 VCBS repeat [Variovorax sp. RA8]